MYFCRHCLSLFLSTIQWVWLLDFVSYKIHIFICSRIFKLIFVWLYFNKITKLSRVEFQSSTWSSYQPNNDLSCICCCFTKNGNKSWSTKQKKNYADTFGGTVLKVQWHYTMQTKKSTMCCIWFVTNISKCIHSVTKTNCTR